jgi:hypothetical protein
MKLQGGSRPGEQPVYPDTGRWGCSRGAVYKKKMEMMDYLMCSYEQNFTTWFGHTEMKC